MVSVVHGQWIERSADSAAEIPFYVGQAVCADCHDRHRDTTPCWLDDIPKHDRSYGALVKPKAEHIAMVSGIAGDPARSRICLGCHATGSDAGARWQTDSFNVADGVQCEACHGPGSLHVERYCEDGGSRGAAVNVGGTLSHALTGSRPRPVQDRTWIQRGDQTQCAACHWPRSSHHAILELGYRVPPADRLYKTPVNLATSPDGAWLYVVCEQSGSVVVVETAGRRVVDEIAVGHQPSDLGLSPDGKVLYVTNRLSNSLSVIDTDAREVVREIAVRGEPHAVAASPNGDFVYVLSTAENAVSVLDARTMEEVRRLAAGQGPWSAALGPGGESLYVTNVRPNPGLFQASPISEITVVDTHKNVVASRPFVAQANMLQGIALIPGSDVVAFTLMRTKSLVPITRLAQGWTITNGLGLVWPDGRVAQVLLDEPNASFPDPMDLAVSPDGRRMLVTSGGSDRVAVVDVAKLLDTIRGATRREREEVLPNHLGMSSRFVVKRVDVGRNPRGVTFSPDGRYAYVANALDDTVSVIDSLDAKVVDVIDLNGPKTVTELRLGARLFHNAAISFGRQFSCRSCHPDGHVNGLTIDIEADGIGNSPVDNRTLRGILDTAPFKWEGTNQTLNRQCGPRLAVFFTRLTPYTPADLTALVRYISTIPRPPNHHRDPAGLTLSQRRGKILFERSETRHGQLIAPDQRCVTCHSGAYGTSRTLAGVGTMMWLDGEVDIPLNDLHETGGFGALGVYYFHDVGTGMRSFDIPHLTNIHNSAPYLHNGSAATLEEIWTRFNLWDEHGVTSDMTRKQFIDLIEYLKAL